MAISKEEYVRSLPNVKLVLGNGFDLYCGLYTKYSDFYCIFFEKYDSLRNLFEQFEINNKSDFSKLNLDLVTVWDVFFMLNSSKDPYSNIKEWCDIEKLILGSLSDEKNAFSYMISKVNWNTIKYCVEKNSLASNHPERFIVDFIKYKFEKLNLQGSNFYRFLLKELKLFENNFGIYIRNQIYEIYDVNFNQFIKNEKYIKLAIKAIENLCSLDNVVSIDSFNYTEIIDSRVSEIYHHINGGYEAPIFGIDSIFDPNDARFLFTKTGRRIDLDLIENNYEQKEEFENVVVFGHSLNQADYSYFFPLLDQIRLLDNLETKKLVFAYSIYNENEEENIKSSLWKRVSQLLFAYAKEKGLSNPERFLDSLSTQKRIIFYEIPELIEKKYSHSMVDTRWQDSLKRVKDRIEHKRMLEEAKKKQILPKP